MNSSPRKVSKPWLMRKPQRVKLAKLVLAYVCSIEGSTQTREPDTYGINGVVGEWNVPTKLGEMRLSYSDEYADIFCRFEDREAASERLGCNPYSGKWNHNAGNTTAILAFESFKVQLDSLL